MTPDQLSPLLMGVLARWVARLPFRRMECAPGPELQVDFGQGARVVENRKRRKTHLFRCGLSYSRKGCSEAVWRHSVLMQPLPVRAWGFGFIPG